MLKNHAFNSNQYRLPIFSLATALILMDQGIKAGVALTMPVGTSEQVSAWFNLVHVLNPGAAFSFLANAGGWQKYFLSAFGLIISAILTRLLWMGIKSFIESFAYILLIGGALGNVLDRLRIGAVVDYLDFHWADLHWPAFNLADIYVMSGAFLLLTISFSTPAVTSEST
jgi:signal peptidase II